MAEKKSALGHSPRAVPQEVYSRLYDLGKQRVHQRNESQFNNGDGASTPMKKTNQSINEAGPMQQSVIKNEHSFKPHIQKKSQEIRRDKPIQEHLYEDFKERQIKKMAALHGQQM